MPVEREPTLFPVSLTLLKGAVVFCISLIMRLNEDDMRKRIPQLMAAALFLSIASSRTSS